MLDFVRTVGGVPYLLEDRDRIDSLPADQGGQGSLRLQQKPRYVEPQLVAGRGIGVHLDEVAYRLRMLEILGQHAVAYRRGNYLAPVWKRSMRSRC